MEELKEKYCKLCLNTINDENFKVVEGYTREIFKFVLFNRELDECNNQVLCDDCFTKLFESYNFKATCLETEDSISTYLDSEAETLCDMKEIFIIVNGSVGVNDSVANQKVCRLCLKLTTNEFICLRDADKDAINKCIPEMNFDTIKNPVVCSACFHSFERYREFLKTGLDTAVRINNFKSFNLKTEEVTIKSESDASESDTTSTSAKKTLLTHKSTETVERIEQPEPDGPRFKCNKCPFVHRFRSSVLYHQLKHKDPSEVKMHKCTKCDFQTKFKYSLKNHQLIHKDPLEMPIHKCDKCKYETNRKRNLLGHQLKHKDASEIRMYMCGECNFQSKRKRSLLGHQAKHRAATEPHVYKCDKCNYGTKGKHNLTHHQLMHKVSL